MDAMEVQIKSMRSCGATTETILAVFGQQGKQEEAKAILQTLADMDAMETQVNPMRASGVTDDLSNKTAEENLSDTGSQSSDDAESGEVVSSISVGAVPSDLPSDSESDCCCGGSEAPRNVQERCRCNYCSEENAFPWVLWERPMNVYRPWDIVEDLLDRPVQNKELYSTREEELRAATNIYENLTCPICLDDMDPEEIVKIAKENMGKTRDPKDWMFNRNRSMAKYCGGCKRISSCDGCARNLVRANYENNRTRYGIDFEPRVNRMAGGRMKELMRCPCCRHETDAKEEEEEVSDDESISSIVSEVSDDDSIQSSISSFVDELSDGEEAVEFLASMGFEREACIEILQATNGNFNAAVSLFVGAD